MSTLIYFNNSNLQTEEVTVTTTDIRNASGSDVQSIALARSNGSRIVNQRYESKIIELEGNVETKTISANIENLLERYYKIFNVDTPRYLRYIPEYEEIITTDTATGWTAGSDTVSLATQTDDYQHGGTSLGFNIDVSNSGNDYAELTYSGTAWDGSSKTKATSNFEFWLNLNDVYYITSIEFRIGNDASNYYSAVYESNYAGNDFENGVNLFSVKWDDMLETGTVSDNALDYIYIKINYDTTAEDINDCYIDGIFWVNEDRVRNYRCMRTGELEMGAEHYQISHSLFRARFLADRGYAESTHFIQLFSTTGIVATSTEQKIDLEGSIEPLPKHTLTVNTATDIEDIRIKNLSNQEEVTFLTTNISNADKIVFGGIDREVTQNGSVMDFSGKIPSTDIGTNRYQLNITSDTPTVVPASAITTNATRSYTVTSTPPSGDRTDIFISQAFTTATADDITAITAELSNGNFGLSSNTKWWILNDSSGAPGSTVISYASGNPISISSGSATGYNISVTTATKYHLVILVAYEKNVVTTGFTTGDCDWDYSTDDDYASHLTHKGEVTYSTSSSIPWGSVSWGTINYDMGFTVTQTPTPSWDIDWLLEYKKLYQA